MEKDHSRGCIPNRRLGEINQKLYLPFKPQNIHIQFYSNGIRDEGLYGFSSGYKIEDESITVSARGTIGYVCLRHRPYTPIVRLITLVPKKEIVSAKYLYLWLEELQNSRNWDYATTAYSS